ncbi:hypothetical protein [Wolbachia endosymbiont (group A) of Anomoia purmunda]|uniref:hypothetical protein n=1 Tax=Wolbachia endosymbiont (group A) of Anomoia purmunda TaxID=2953978 RepID=UPI002231D86A|nr:hypothetical protein [Wolbachia endosymbiont (group A) of Anomoia purmunda]
MGTNDTQQEHIYNKRIQEIFSLFNERKKEDDPIYNARVDFNTVKFLTERTNWDWNKDKDEACGVILQECDKTNKARQELEDKAKEELNKYITIANNINDDVKDKKVSIYGNHASITLEDNKKEFKISEFLNSDFCQKNGISGFSTLHSDGKSGMHGFVAEEGEGKEKRKVRHYVVTDGSYEMTLNWYVNGEKCTIKINIDKDGVELIEGNGVTEDQLKANKDVKIGGLFLHKIEFGKKGKAQESEVQHNTSSFETTIRRDVKRDVKRDVSIQATDITRKKEDHHSHFGPQSNIRRQSYDSGIGKDFDDKINSQEAKEKRELRQAARKANSGGQVYNLQSLFEENPQNKKTPPQVPTRTSSLPPEKDVFNEQGRSKLGSQKPDDLRENEQTPNNQQKGEHQPTTVSSGNNYGFPSSDPSDFTKSVSHNQDNRQKDERYYNPTFATFEHAVPGSQKPDRSEQTPNDQQQPKTQQQEGNSKGDLLQDIRNFKKNNLRHIDVDDREASIAGSRKNNLSPLETLKDRIPYSPSPDNSDNQDASDAKWKESEQPLSATALNNKSDSGYSSQIHAQPQVDPEQPKRSLENIEQSDQTPPENLLKEIRDRSQQDNRGLRQVDSTDKLSQDKEDELQKDDLADVKIVEGPTVSVSASTPNSISDSGYISPTNSDSKSQTDLKQVGRKLEEYIRQSNLTLFEELKNTLGQENLGLKPADQSQISEETKKRLREVGLLKDSSTDIKANDSGYSSPTHANHEQSQVNPGQLKASLMNVEQRDDTLLTEFTSKLDKETQKFPLKPVDQKEMSEQTKERLSEAGLLKDGLADVQTVAEQKNADTNLTIDNSSNLYKLLEKDEAQLKAGVIEEERGDTLTEHTDGYDRNRIALANRNKRPLDWAKQVAESQQKKDTNKGISI